MPAANVIKLRALLSEKFPGLRMNPEIPCNAEYKFQRTGLPQADEPLHGGLPKGSLTEIIVAGPNCGSASLLLALLQPAAEAGEIIALIDGNDSFDVAQLDENILSRLLWIRCRSVTDAIKAADLALRDGNLPRVLLDLKLNSENQLRKISAATWHRFQRLVEETGAVCVVLTPCQMVASARVRITLHPQFCLGALERDAEELLRELKMDVSNPRKHAVMELSQINI